LAVSSSWQAAAVGRQQQLAVSSSWQSAAVGRQQSVGYELYNFGRGRPVVFGVK